MLKFAKDARFVVGEWVGDYDEGIESLAMLKRTGWGKLGELVLVEELEEQVEAWQYCLSSLQLNMKALVVVQVFPTQVTRQRPQAQTACRAIGHCWDVRVTICGKKERPR